MSTQTQIGTSHFVDMAAALRYYETQGIDEAGVENKLLEGAIHLGPPKVKKGELVTLVDGGTRYAIIENPTDEEVIKSVSPNLWDMTKTAYKGGDRRWFPCSEEFYHDMLGSVPPLYVGKWWACGEPWSHTGQGEEVLLFFRSKPGFACRMATAKEIIAEQSGRSQGQPSANAGHSRSPRAYPLGWGFNEADCGGVFDGNSVTSDADPGL